MGPENACKLKIDVDIKTHATMAFPTASLKRNTSKKYDENAKCGWTFSITAKWKMLSSSLALACIIRAF